MSVLSHLFIRFAGCVKNRPIVKLKMEPQTVEGDLLDQDVDVIVKAWNRNINPRWLLLTQRVSEQSRREPGMIHSAGYVKWVPFRR